MGEGVARKTSEKVRVCLWMGVGSLAELAAKLMWGLEVKRRALRAPGTSFSFLSGPGDDGFKIGRWLTAALAILSARSLPQMPW